LFSPGAQAAQLLALGIRLLEPATKAGEELRGG